MLAPGLLCFRGWSHTGNILYGVAGMLLMAGSFAIFLRSPHLPACSDLIQCNDCRCIALVISVISAP